MTVMDRSFRDDSDGNSSSDGSDKAAPKDFMRSLPGTAGKRTRKARRVFDPSDNNMPKSKLGKRQAMLLPMPQVTVALGRPPKIPRQDPPSSPSASNKSSPEKTPQKDYIPVSPPNSTPSTTPTKQVGGCVICLKDTSSKTLRLINCKMKNCTNQVHPLCLRTMPDITAEAPMKHALKWRCLQCRKCTICTKKRDLKMYPNEWMVVCSACDETFHATCHSPALLRKPTSKWNCYRCTVDRAVAAGCKTVVYADAPPLIIDMPKEPEPVVVDEENKAIPDEIGDVVEWTASDLATYFKDKGFHDEAKIMEEQEVDGKSLLLMSRLDVLRGLKLKLGPALRMYTNHVQPMKEIFFKV
ncbi:zinc finger protein DPF3 [Neocloeon triangulifer]|uniref:zinc finger protein DPF3 n=1 Tax=Neocloeon triangulifer TaxID=2078957 RepID=UPI00286F4734|nr:zinc finger protein DPF3 [Neocloeon triangulifer]